MSLGLPDGLFSHDALQNVLMTCLSVFPKHKQVTAAADWSTILPVE